MDRRKALKNIGTGIGAIAVTPTVVSMFQSCQTAASYTPVYFSAEDFKAVAQFMVLILPSTEIPGAIELKLPEFADAYIKAVWSEEDQKKLATGWAAFLNATKQATGKDAAELENADWDAQLAKYLKPGMENPTSEATAVAFAEQLRSLTVNAFKANEYIGENVLAYAPVPGDYKGCVDLQETTGGKAWSL